MSKPEKMQAAAAARRRQARRRITSALKVLTVVALGGTAFLVWRTSPVQKKAVIEKLAPSPQSATWWEPIMIPRTQYGVQPVLPALPPYTAGDPVIAVNDITSLEYHQLAARVDHLILNHPDLQLREELKAALASGKLHYAFDDQKRTMAWLGIFPQGVLAPYHESDRPAMLVILALDPVLLSRIETQQQMLGVMAVIGHEFQHYKEWLIAPPEHWGDFLPHDRPNTMSPEECRRNFRNELEGYGYECRHLVAWYVRAEDMANVCEAVDIPTAFAQRLFWMFTAGQVGKTYPSCIPYWAEIAGHPHPEAFRTDP